MPFIIKPSTDDDLSNATLADDKTLPDVISGIASGTYQIGRLAWNPESVLVGGGDGVFNPDPVEPYIFSLVNYNRNAFGSDELNIISEGSGLISLWFFNTDSQWDLYRLKNRLFSLGVGDSKIELYAERFGQLSLGEVIGSDSTSGNPISFYSDNNLNGFNVDVLYHVLIAWNATNIDIYVNNILVKTSPNTIFQPDTTFDNFFLAARNIYSYHWKGSIGQVYFNMTDTLDLSQQSNLDRFTADGQPISLGSNGKLPTGTIPAIFIDAPFDQVSNLGNGGDLTLVE